MELLRRHLDKVMKPVVAQIMELLAPHKEAYSSEIVMSYLKEHGVFGDSDSQDEAHPVRRKKRRKVTKRITKRHTIMTVPSKTKKGPVLKHSALKGPLIKIVAGLAQSKSPFTIDDITPELDKLKGTYSRMTVTQLLANPKFIQGIESKKKTKSPVSGRQVNVYTFTGKPVEEIRRRK
jgi:hypothetical protein